MSKKTKWQKNFELANRLDITDADAKTLRRAAMTLHRWFELECGTDKGAIELDESNNKWYFMSYTTLKPTRYRIADRETGARKRIDEVCQRNKLSYFIQTDPRGCSLYVSRKYELKENDYTNGIAICD